ncbi:hypothetical protein [Streptomyces phaeofaciens]|uniref:hypothetical protein n=1 Tax=Streptomyces phaeofaciens TaxID=68254 RepID=UPI00368CFD8D
MKGAVLRDAQAYRRSPGCHRQSGGRIENGLITVRNVYARYGRLYPRVPAPTLSHYWEQRRRPSIVMRRAGRPAPETT